MPRLAGPQAVSAWHWLIHVAGVDYGLPYGHWGWYNAWSGIGSDLGELTLAGGLAAVYRKHQCHRRRCWRFGHHDFTDEKTSVTYRLCRKCHPAHPGSRALTRHHIARIHGEGRERLMRPGNRKRSGT